MASTQEFMEYVVENLYCAGDISYKKMFGEYGVYLSGKIIGLVCDNQLFIKKTKSGALLLEDPIEAPPYKGASLYFLIENIEDKELIKEFIYKTYLELPMQKTRKK